MLQACKQMEAMRGPMSGSPTSTLLKKAMGVAQHHDAVSGTEKQHVANDYAKRLYAGRKVCKVWVLDGCIHLHLMGFYY